MKENELQKEASRCLKCKNAKCSNACPIHTSIPEVIDLFLKKEYEKAGEILFENNPISLVCSLICPFERQCMGNCIRGIKGEPVKFPEIENYIMKKYLEEKKLINKEDEKKDVKGRVAVVGAGPGGISAAFYLNKQGYDVTMYDDHNEIGGMLRYGIPSFRLDRNSVNLLADKVIESGIKFIGGVTFTEESLKELKDKEKFDGVLVSTGAWLPKKISLKGSENEKVIYGIDYLKDDMDLGKGNKVVVIGAGNVAMDVARTAKRQENEVLIAYRRTIEEAPATRAEISETIKDGVEFKTRVTPVEVTDEGIILESRDTGVQFLEKCDRIILAISQESQFKPEAREGYFYGGDLLTGPETVVKASLTAREGAELLNRYLEEKE